MTATAVAEPVPEAPAPPRRDRRLRYTFVLAGIGLVVFGVVSLCVGRRVLGPGQAIAALFGQDDASTNALVQDSRLPRTLIAACVGAALAVAGATSQALTRNPLAGPSVLGLVHASAFAVVALIAVASPGPGVLTAAAVLGSTVCFGAVFAFASVGSRGPSPARLTLAGVGLTGVFLAGIEFFVIYDEVTFESARRWISGSLADRPLDALLPVLPVLAVGWILALAMGPALDLLETGDEVASSLGQRVLASRLGAGAAVCLLTGAAVAVGGPIVFIGLMVPHVCRKLVGAANRAVIPASLVVGALFLVVADTIARRPFGAGELPVGVITALVGGPVFVLVAREARRIAVTQATAPPVPLDAPPEPTGLRTRWRARDRYVGVRLPWTTVRFRPAVPLAFLALAAVAVAALVAHLVVGEYHLSVGAVIDALRGDGDAGNRFVVRQLRLPRPLVGLAAGAAFGLSGALLQRVTGNDLASPDLLGVMAGANLGVTVLTFGFPELPATMRLPVALVCGLAAGLLVLLVAGGGGRAPLRVLLIGAGVTVVAQAVVAAVAANGELVHAFRIVLWIVGGLYGRSWTELNIAVNSLFVLAPAAFLLSRRLDHMEMGDDLAVAVGVPVRSTRGAAFVVACSLAAVGVATTGPIAFVGLAAPHLARRLVGDATAGLLAVSAAAGAAVVVIADLVARTALAPREIPTGVLVPLVGVPVLLTLLHRQGRDRA